jgi:hypothetical protein
VLVAEGSRALLSSEAASTTCPAQTCQHVGLPRMRDPGTYLTSNTAGFSVVKRIWQKPAKRLERCVGSAIEIILVVYDQDGIGLRTPSTRSAI